LGLGSPDPDLSGAVSPAWVYLRRSTVVSEVSPVMKITAARLCSLKDTQEKTLKRRENWFEKLAAVRIGSELMNQLTGPFQPQKFENEYQKKLSEGEGSGGVA